MMIGRTPWETEAGIYSHGEFWIDYYHKAAAETIGRMPDRSVIEEDVSGLPHIPGKYRLRLEWDSRQIDPDVEYRRQVQRIAQGIRTPGADVQMSCEHVFPVSLTQIPEIGEWLTCWKCANDAQVHS